MSYEYSQTSIPDAQTLLRENNTLRLTIDSLHDELQAMKFKSATMPNPFLETQLLSLKSENQQLLNEREHLLRQLQSPRHSETSAGVQGQRRDKRDGMFDESRRTGDIMMDLKQRNSHFDSFEMQRQNNYYAGDNDDYNALQGKLLALTTETERLNRIIRDREREIEISRSDMINPESVRITILELENRVVVLGAENQRLNAMLSDRNKEVETLHLKLSSQASVMRSEEYLNSNIKYDDLVNEIERLNILLHEKDREIGDIRMNQGVERSSQRLEPKRKEGEKKAGRYDAESSSIQGREVQVETQFLQLENRMKELEQERNNLHIELEDARARDQPFREKMEDLTKEVEVWKEKYKNLLREAKQQEHYETEIRRLKDEIDRSRTTFELKNREIESWRRKYDEIHKIADENRDFGKKTTVLLTENERVNTLLLEKKKEIEDLKKKLEGQASIEEKIGSLVTENQRIMKSLNDKASEYDALKNKYEGGDRILGSPQASRPRMIELERRLRTVEGDNERVKGIYNEKYREAESLKKKIREIKEQSEAWKSKFYENESALVKVTQSNTRLETKVNSLRNENSKLDSMLEEKIKHTTTLQMKIFSVSELEGNVKMLTQERERLEGIAERQRKEIGEMADKSVKLEVVERKFRETERQLDASVKECEDLKGFLREREIELGDTRISIRELEENSHKVFRLEEVLNHLAHENEAISAELDDRRQEVKEWREKVKDLQGRNMRVAELETRVELMAAENERLSENMKKKDREIRESQFLSVEAGGHEGRVKELQDTIKWLMEENEHMKATLEKTNRELLQFESKLKAELTEDKGFGEVVARLNVVETENAGYRQIVKDRESELKNWMFKYENISRQLKGEKGLQDKVIALETENSDLRESVTEKNGYIQGIARTGTDTDELRHRNQRLEAEKVLLCAEVDRLWEDNMAIRKEKEQLERRILGFSQELHQSGGGSYQGEGFPESPKRSGYGTEAESLGGTGEGFNRESTKLKRMLANKERELEYFREKGVEYERAEAVIESLEGKLEMIAIENEELKRKLKETTDRLSSKLKDKEIELYDLKILLESQKSARGGGDNLMSSEEHGQQIEILQKEVHRLNKANKEYLKDIDSWKGKHLALEQGYFRIGELEVRLEEATKEAEKLRQLLNGKEKEIKALKKRVHGSGDESSSSDSSNEGNESTGQERYDNYEEDVELYKRRENGNIDDGYNHERQDINIDDLRKVIERKEKEIKAIRGDDSLMTETLTVIGRSGPSDLGN